MSISERFEGFLRRHPWVFRVLLFLLAVLVAGLLIGRTKGPELVYKAF